MPENDTPEIEDSSELNQSNDKGAKGKRVGKLQKIAESVQSAFTNKPDGDEDGGLEIIEQADPSEIKLLNPEPTDNSLKAKLSRKLGIGKTMVEGRWSGLPHWRCPKCLWTTFKAEVADNHRC